VSHPRWGQGERVCFITEHTRLSTVALQLNSPIEVTFKELASSKGYDCAEDQPVYRGGDYNSSALIMLHDHAWYSANTMVVNTEWSISSDLHMLEKIIHGNTPNFYRYVLGITAWPHQGLERDLASERPTWIALNSPSLDIVMSDASQQYELALEAVGSGFWNSYF
jgi:putative AlgH/UPF0301 family transcriptional regulator